MRNLEILVLLIIVAVVAYAFGQANSDPAPAMYPIQAPAIAETTPIPVVTMATNTAARYIVEVIEGPTSAPTATEQSRYVTTCKPATVYPLPLAHPGTELYTMPEHFAVVIERYSEDNRWAKVYNPAAPVEWWILTETFYCQ